MRKLIAFFQRFRVFLVFLILQFISLGLFFSWLSYPRTKFFNTSSTIVAQILDLEHALTKFFTLHEANEKLQKEIIELKEKQPKSFLSIDPKTKLINDTILKQAFRYIPATVINSSFSSKNNFFTIDAGRLKGIKEKMGVVSTDGIVGIVYDLSDHYAVVKSILTENINISAYIENNDAFGILKYNENDPRFLTLTGIPNDILIEEGRIVKSRGSSGHFPKGLMIGTVDQVTSIEGKTFWDIRVKIAQDMRRIQYVYVINNLMGDELEMIQKQYFQPE